MVSEAIYEHVRLWSADLAVARARPRYLAMAAEFYRNHSRPHEVPMDMPFTGRSGQVDTILTVFVPGKLRNPLNGSWGGWRKHSRLAKDWRDKTAVIVLVATRLKPPEMPRWTRKRVTFTAHVGSLWDDDAIPAAIKPVRDALVDAGIISSDGPRSGNQFVYDQIVNRKERGVEISIEEVST